MDPLSDHQRAHENSGSQSLSQCSYQKKISESSEKRNFQFIIIFISDKALLEYMQVPEGLRPLSLIFSLSSSEHRHHLLHLLRVIDTHLHIGINYLHYSFLRFNNDLHQQLLKGIPEKPGRRRTVLFY